MLSFVFTQAGQTQPFMDRAGSEADNQKLSAEPELQPRQQQPPSYDSIRSPGMKPSEKM